ncbi:MAG: ABC transporter permease [Clostridia bacterium]
MKKSIKILQRVHVCAFFAFMYLPIAVLMAFSFNESTSRAVFTGFTFQWYVNLLENEMILESLVVSLILALVSSTIATVMGTMASVGISRMKKTSRSIIMNISYMPIINPEIVTGVSLMLIFVVFNSSITEVFSWLLDKEISMNLFGYGTLLVAHITFSVPYVIFNVVPKIRKMDKRLYEAALDLGCNHTQAFFKVVLPDIMPAVVSSFLICLTYSIDDFVISYFTSGTTQTLPIAIYSMTKKQVSPEINALSTVMFVVIMSIILIANAMDTAKEKRKHAK